MTLIMCKAHYFEEDEHPTTDVVGVCCADGSADGSITPRPDRGVWLQDRVCTDQEIAAGKLEPQCVVHPSLATICWLHGGYEPAGVCPRCEVGR